MFSIRTEHMSSDQINPTVGSISTQNIKIRTKIQTESNRLCKTKHTIQTLAPEIQHDHQPRHPNQETHRNPRSTQNPTQTSGSENGPIQKNILRDHRSDRRSRDLTISVLVEEAEGLLELGDLVVGELIRHRERDLVDSRERERGFTSV